MAGVVQPYDSKDDLAKLFYTARLASDINNITEHIITQEELWDSRYEWQAFNAEDKPLYQGLAPPGSLITDPVWKIQKFTFAVGPAGTNVPVSILTLFGAWSNRANL